MALSRNCSNPGVGTRVATRTTSATAATHANTRFRTGTTVVAVVRMSSPAGPPHREGVFRLRWGWTRVRG